MSNLPTETHDLETLAATIQSVHRELARRANKAVNVSLTMRNWLIGYYIAEYELRGSDRAQYGEMVLQRLSDRLTALNVSSCDKRRLEQYLQFYRTYPQIARTVSAQFQTLPLKALTAEPTIARSANSQFDDRFVNQLSYSHFELLVRLDLSEKRAFYEDQCLNGSWSVRQLKRQINSLLFERSQLSIKSKKLVEHKTQSNASLSENSVSRELPIRDPYVFEFLGLRPREVMSESYLEDELLDKLQEFLIELGQGFFFLW